MLLIGVFIITFLLYYKVVDNTFYFDEKQKAHVVEYLWSVILPICSLKVLMDIYIDNSLLEKGHTVLSDRLLELYIAGTMVDFYLCYKEYPSYFTKITIIHHILWLSIGFTTLYNNASIYGAYVYFIEVPCIIKCWNKFFTNFKNILLFAQTWVIFRIFYFGNLIPFLSEEFEKNFPILNNFKFVWWGALIMHIWWGGKLILKNEKETNLFKMIRRPYLLNGEFRPQYRGIIQYLLYHYKIIDCITILYFYRVWHYDYNYLYILNGSMVYLNIYYSWKMHCNDLIDSQSNVRLDKEVEAYYWRLDELSINGLIFSRYLLLSTQIDYPNYYNVIGYTLFLSNCYHIYTKNNLKKYDFNSKDSFPNHYKLSHFLFCSLFLFSGMYCYYIIPKTISPMIGWCVYCLAFLIYYSKFCYVMNNKYIQQHDIAHFVLICNFGWFLLTDIYRY